MTHRWPLQRLNGQGFMAIAFSDAGAQAPSAVCAGSEGLVPVGVLLLAR